MTFSDVGLIVKKILVGIILVLIPVLILWGGLQLTVKLLSPNEPSETVTIQSNP